MIQIYLSTLDCLEENDSSASDEPYVLVTAINLRSTARVQGFDVPLPTFDVVRYGPFEGVDAGGTYLPPPGARPFWFLNGEPADLANPEDVIFIVAAMEHDAGRPGTLQGIVQGVIAGSVFGTLGRPRDERVGRLLRDVSSALGTPSGPSLDQDDVIGEPQELRFSREELTQAESGRPVRKALNFEGGGGRYILTFEARSPVWRRFANMAGEFSGQPASVSWGAGHLELFNRRHDGSVWHKWWDNGAVRFSEWENLGGHSTTDNISAISWGFGHIEVFVRGPDNAIWHKWWHDGWHGWESLGGNFASPPTALTWGPGHIELFALTADGHVWHKWWQNGWHGWEDLGGTFLPESRISAVSWGMGHIEVFVRGNDNAIWHKWWQDGWHGWESLGGNVVSAPSALTWGPGHIEVFAFTSDGHVWHKWWHDGWHGWEDLGGTFDSRCEISPESWGVGHLHVFVKGNDDGLWHKWWNNGWHGWDTLAGELATSPNAISWGPGHLNVFVRDHRGGIWHTWWNHDHWGP